MPFCTRTGLRLKSREDRVGYAVIIPHLHKKSIMWSINNFRRRTPSQECALHQISTYEFPKAIIFSDSLSVLNSLSSPDKGNSHPAVYKIKSILHSFNKSGRVGLCWILPAHRDIPNNERADAALKESLLLPDSLLLAKCHYTNLYSRFKKEAKMEAINIVEKEANNKGKRYFNEVEAIFSLVWGCRGPPAQTGDPCRDSDLSMSVSTLI